MPFQVLPGLTYCTGSASPRLYYSPGYLSMGGGASSLNRLRKAIVIRAYNLRKPDDTVDDQFRRFAVRGADGVLYISFENIKRCLLMETKEYEWIDQFLHHAFGTEMTVIHYHAFLKFLESGKTPAAVGPDSGDRPSRSATPPVPPRLAKGGTVAQDVLPPTMSSSSSYRSIADAASIRIEHAFDGGTNSRRTASRVPTNQSTDPSDQDEEEHPLESSVLSINLSAVAANPETLPRSVRLHNADGGRMSARSGADEEESEEVSYSVVLHPSRSASKLAAAPTLPLWRKRETVRQERTVHYTTIDANGEQQELVERETTQSEVLHMECKETGEFAHRETTQYEQMETFNEEVVAENRGVEEYVHLKSKDDEYHHMESTMPRRGEGEEDAEGGEGGGEGQTQDGGNGPAGDGGANERDGEQAVLDEEYAEAYRLYQQKLAEDRERGQHPDDLDGIFRDSSGVHAPSPRPPPFSDDTAQGVAYGFGDDEHRRAADAFAFTEEMEHMDQGSPPPVFGERVAVDDEGMETQQSSTARRNGDRDYLFERDHDMVPGVPEVSGTVLHDPGAVGDHGAGALDRCTSYGSLHDID